MMENTENITKGGIVLRVLMAAVFFIAAGAGAFLVFGPAPETKNESFSGNIEQATELVKPEKLFIAVVGDIMLDRHVLSLVRRSGDYTYPFGKIDSYLNQADLRVGNLEGPMTDNDSVSLTTNGMRFTFPTDYLSPLGDRFEVLGIGNNHALDFGEEGLRQTKNNLTREGISFFGDYLNRGDNNSVVIKKNGIKIGFVGYHSLTEKGFSNVLLDAEKMKAMCDFVIVMPHWGEEYELTENDAQREAAKKLIDAGADVVIGGHPHVTQPLSVYKGKVIFWSIGNFVFDQYFSEETMRSISPTIELTKQPDGTIAAKYGIVPISIGKDSRPFAMDSEAAGIFLNNIAERSDVTDAGKSDIRSGKIDPLTADKKSSDITAAAVF